MNFPSALWVSPHSPGGGVWFVWLRRLVLWAIEFRPCREDLQRALIIISMDEGFVRSEIGNARYELFSLSENKYPSRRIHLSQLVVVTGPLGPRGPVGHRHGSSRPVTSNWNAGLRARAALNSTEISKFSWKCFFCVESTGSHGISTADNKIYGSVKIWREFKLAKKKVLYNFIHVLYSIVHETKIFVHLPHWRKIEIKIRAQIWRFERGFLTSYNFQLYF